jgi:hypothetical protein
VDPRARWRDHGAWHSSDVDLSVGDTLDQLFEIGKFVATGRAEALKRNALLTLDLMYLNLKENVQTAIGAGIDLRFKQLILEFGGGYHLGEWSVLGGGLPTLSVDLLGGGRFVHLNSGLTIENFADVDKSKDWRLLATFGETGWFGGLAPCSGAEEGRKNRVTPEGKFLYFPH